MKFIIGKHSQQFKALSKADPKLYWLGIGKDAFLYASVTNLRKRYDEEGFKYEYYESSGRIPGQTGAFI